MENSELRVSDRAMVLLVSILYARPPAAWTVLYDIVRFYD